MTNDEIIIGLTKQQEILEQVLLKLDVQERFLNTPHMKGLNRILEEQAVLFEEFTALGKQLNQSTEWKKEKQFQALIAALDKKYTLMLESCNRLLQEATTKRKGIASEIGRTKQQRHIKHKYVSQWYGTVRPRFNVTG